MKRKKRILSLLLAITVMATMLVALPLTGYAATTDYKPADKTTIAAGQFYDDENITMYNMYEITTTSPDSQYQKLYGNSSDGAIDTSNVLDTYSSRIGLRSSGNISAKFETWNNENTGNTAIKIVPKSDGKLTAYVGCQGNRSIKLWNNTDGTQQVVNTVDTTNKRVHAFEFDMEASKDYYLYNHGFGAQLVNIVFEPKSTDPILTLDHETLSLAPGASEIITADLQNSEDAIVWSSSNDVVSVDGEGASAVVTVSETANTGDTATITATAAGLTATCLVTVVEPVNDVIVTAAAGVKKVELVSTTDESLKYSVEYTRANGSEASKGDDGNRDYKKAIANVPYGDYNVNISYVDEYYTANESNPATVTVGSGDAVALSVKADKKTGVSSTSVNYDKLKGTTVTWSFNTKTGVPNEYLSLQYVSDTSIYSDTYEDDVYLLVNTESGKFNSIDRPGDCQANSGTVLSVPVVPGSVVTFDGIGVKIDETEEYASGTSYTYNGTENGTVAFTSTGGYLNTVKVTSPTTIDSVKTYTQADVIGGAKDKPDGTTYTFVDGVSSEIKTLFAASGDSAVVDSKYSDKYADYLGGTDSRAAHPYINGFNLSAGIYKVYYLGYNHIENNKIATLTDGNDNEITTITVEGNSGIETASNGSKTLYTDVFTLNVTQDVTGAKITFDTAGQWLPDLYGIAIVNTHGFTDSEADSGYYTVNDAVPNSEADKIYVARFFQGYQGAEVSEYGFYVLETDAAVVENEFKTFGTGNLGDGQNGFYATVTGLTGGATYYAKPYVVVSGEVFYGNSIQVTVSTSEDDWVTAASVE